MRSSFTELQSQFDLLQENYNSLSNSDIQLNYQKLLWNIATTPFETFKTMWNFDFLGFNFAWFITGILSLFVIVYILKKIF